MSTPLAALVGSVVPASAPAEPGVVQGTVVADGKTGAVAKLAEILKTLVVKAGAYHSEEAQRIALEAIEDFKRIFSTGNPLVLENHSAPWEDVSKRPVPAGAAAPALPPGFAIDYNALARALLAAQQEGSQ